MWQSGKMNERPPGHFGGFDSLAKYGAKSEVKEIKSLESSQRRTTISISELLNPETPDSGHNLSAVSDHYQLQGDKQAGPGDKPSESPYAGGADAQSHLEPEIGCRYTYILPSPHAPARPNTNSTAIQRGNNHTGQAPLKTRTRTSTKPIEKGNNDSGSGGKLRCIHCRRRRQKVPIISPIC